MTTLDAPEPAVREPSSTTADPRELRRRIDLPALTTRQLDRATPRVPAVAALPPDVRDGPLHDALRNATERVLVALLEARPLTDGEAGEIARGFAEVMAAWALVIDDVAVLFASAAEGLWEQVARHASPDQLRVLLTTITEGLDSSALVERIHAESAALQDPRSVAAERAARAALRLEQDALPPSVTGPGSERLVVARRPRRDPREHAAVATALREAGYVAATTSDHVVGRVPAGREAPVLPGTTVVVEAAPRAGSFADRRRRLEEVATAAERSGRRGTLTDLDHAPERLLLSSPDIGAVLAGELRALARTTAAWDPLATARAFVDADGSVSALAAGLRLHRESARHRVRRIGMLLGLDLGSPRDRVVLDLLLFARDVTPIAPGPPPPTTSLRLAAIVGRIDRSELEARIEIQRAARHESFASHAEELRTWVRGDVDEVLALLLNESPSRERDLVGASRQTIAQLRAGASPPEVAAAARETAQAVWRAVLDVARDDESSVLAAGPGRLVLYIEAVQLAIAHLAEGRPGTTRLLQTLLDRDAPAQATLAACAGAGLGLDEARRTLVVVPIADGAPPHRLAMDLRSAGLAATVHEGRVVGLAPAEADDRAIASLVPVAATYALGPAAPLRCLGDWLRRTGLLLEALTAEGHTGPVDLSHHAIDLLLLGRPDIARTFEDSVLEPLRRRDAARGGSLAQTLVAYVDCDFSRQGTARALHLHPNSVDHRLRLIAGELDRSLTRHQDQLALLLAVSAARLRTSDRAAARIAHARG